MEFGLVEVWSEMGLIARAVVLLLIVMSVVAVAVSVERARALWRGTTGIDIYARTVQARLDEGDLEGALSVPGEGAGHLARVVSAGLRSYLTHRAAAPDRDAILTTAEAALDRAVSQEGSHLRRGLGSLATIGSTAPFVGLFGTVVGIIDAFAEISRTGVGGMETVSAGIAEALVATALGIVVAVPAVVLFNYFSVRAEAAESDLGEAASALLDALRRDGWNAGKGRPG